MANISIFEQKSEQIRGVISSVFGPDFLTKTRKREVVYPRQIYVHCLCVFTDVGLKTIARDVGYKDHTTVIHSVQNLRGLCRYNEQIKKDVIHVESIIEAMME